MIEHHRVIFLPVDVDDLFAFRNGCKRLIDNLNGFERLCGRVQLPKAAVDQNQARHRLLFFLQTLVTARDHFSHRREIIHTFDRLDDEFSIV